MQKENVKWDNRILIDFWDQAFTLSEKQNKLGVLRLIEATPLQDSYLRLRYQVIG